MAEPQKDGGVLVVTEMPKEAMQERLKSLPSPPGGCVRPKVTPDGKVGFLLDVEREGHQVVRHGEKNVLVVNYETAQQLEAEILKYRVSEEKDARLTFLRKGNRKMSTDRPAGDLGTTGGNRASNEIKSVGKRSMRGEILFRERSTKKTPPMNRDM